MTSGITEDCAVPHDQANLRATGAKVQPLEGISEVRRQLALLKTGALQNAILTSANFSIIATDEQGIIQLFNVGAERMLGYTAAEVVNKINPSDIHDPAEVAGARRRALSASWPRHPRRASRRWPSRPRAASKTSTT